MVTAVLSMLLLVLVPFFHVYTNNVTNLELPLSSFKSDLGWLSALVFLAVWVALTLTPSKLEPVLIALVLAMDVFFWLQINFFIGDYGFLMGTEPQWQSNEGLGIVQLVCLIVLPVLFLRYRIVLIDNLNFIAGLLLISCAVYLPQWYEDVSKPALKKYTFVKDGVYDFSSRKNVIVIVVDTAQADVVNEIFQKTPDLANSFEGFTFFRNATSSFPKTYASIPALLSGRPLDNTEPLQDYLSTTYTDYSLPAVLRSNHFDVRLWSSSPRALVANPLMADNIVDAGGEKTDLKQDKALIANMMLFRLAPHFLKPLIYNDGLFLVLPGDLPGDPGLAGETCKLEPADRRYSRDLKTFDTRFYDEFLACARVITEQPVFRFYHLYGAHAPLRFDKSFNYIGHQPLNRDNFLNQTQGSLQVLTSVMKRLEEMQVYDQATIVIAGDHGGGEYPVGINLDQPGIPASHRQALSTPVPLQRRIGALPLIMVKPAGSSGHLKISDAPVALVDVPGTVMADLDADTGFFPGLPMFSIEDSAERTRTYKFYEFSGWNTDYILPMTEYLIKGFSWDPGAWHLSARDLNANASAGFNGELVTFQEGGTLERAEPQGFSAPLRLGRTVTARTATLRFGTSIAGPALLSMVHMPFESDSHTESMRLLVAGTELGRWIFNSADGQRRKSVYLDAARVALLAEYPLQVELDHVGSKVVIREIRLTSTRRYLYRPGALISFTDTGNSSTFRTFGWSRTEFWGTSTIGYQSGLHLQLDDYSGQPLQLGFRASGYVFDKWPEQIVDVQVNGERVSRLRIHDNRKNDYHLDIPASLVSAEGDLDITFVYQNPVRPSTIGASSDTRLQALALISLQVDVAKTTP